MQIDSNFLVVVDVGMCVFCSLSFPCVADELPAAQYSKQIASDLFPFPRISFSIFPFYILPVVQRTINLRALRLCELHSCKPLKTHRQHSYSVNVDRCIMRWFIFGGIFISACLSGIEKDSQPKLMLFFNGNKKG